MAFIRLNRMAGLPFKRNAGVGGLVGRLPKDEVGWVETQERWALRLMLGAPVMGLLVGIFSAIMGLGFALLGFMLGATLRVNATCIRHVMNQQEMIKLQRELVLEVRNFIAESAPATKG